jgi:hypothetical protein
VIKNFGHNLCSLDLENQDDSEVLTSLIRFAVARLRAPRVGHVEFGSVEEELVTSNYKGYSIGIRWNLIKLN